MVNMRETFILAFGVKCTLIYIASEEINLVVSVMDVEGIYLPASNINKYNILHQKCQYEGFFCGNYYSIFVLTEHL